LSTANTHAWRQRIATTEKHVGRLQAMDRNTKMSTIAQHYARFVREATIPDTVFEEMRWHALDTIGVCLVANSLAYARLLAELTIADGGAPEATLLGLPERVPARSAAFFNGCLGHGLDFDDTHLDAVLHPTATLFPAMLALAEKYRRSGPDLLTAMALGIEMTARLGLAGGPALLRRGVHPTSSCGTLGAALGAAWMMRLSEQQTVSAIGIAAAHASGLHESTIDGSSNKCIHSGIAAQAGLLAAELASRGFTAPATSIEGSYGFLRSLAGEGAYDLAELTHELGSRWEATRLAYKVYPCCQGLHPYIDCALDIAARHSFAREDIECIEVRVSTLIGLRLCEPIEEKIVPPSEYGAKFSMPYAVASALIDRDVGHATFLPDTVRQNWRSDLARKVRYVVDEHYAEGVALRGYVSVLLRDGRELTQQTLACRGTPQNPWSAESITRKFFQNAVPAVGDEQATRIFEFVSQLRATSDLRHFTASLACSPGAVSGDLESV
jgi:2-methylcitrate dehydratase PrpD